MTELAISMRETARRLDVSDWTVRQMVKAGELPVVRIRGRVMVPTRALAEWVEAHTQQAS